MTTGLFEMLGRDRETAGAAAGREDAADFARLIRCLVGVRRDRRLKQKQIASLMGTTQSTVSDFERLGGDPRFSTIQRYARAVGAKVRITVIADGDGEWTPIELTRVTVPSAPLSPTITQTHVVLGSVA